MHVRFCATIRSPARSIISLIAPVKLRAVASGLMIEKVRSIAIALYYGKEGRKGRIAAAYSERDVVRQLRHSRSLGPCRCLLVRARKRGIPGVAIKTLLCPKRGTGGTAAPPCHTSARRRAGPPVASFTFAKPTTSMAPTAGTLSRLATFSNPQRPDGNQAR